MRASLGAAARSCIWTGGGVPRRPRGAPNLSTRIDGRATRNARLMRRAMVLSTRMSMLSMSSERTLSLDLEDIVVTGVEAGGWCRCEGRFKGDGEGGSQSAKCLA